MTTPSQPYKVCPRCQVGAPLTAQNCANCGHVYRTQFVPPDQTIAIGAQPLQPPQQTQVYSPPPAYPVQQVLPPQQLQQPAWYGQVPDGCIRKPFHQPAIAVLFSILLTGAGQWYNGQIGKGFVMLLGGIVIMILTLGFGAIAVWIVAAIDAGMVAGRLQRGEYVTAWTWF